MNTQIEKLPKSSLKESSESQSFLNDVHTSMISTIKDYSNDLLCEMTLEHFKSKGKMLRPLFVYKLAKVFNIEPSKVLSWAVACELLHNATLIHDDLQDGDVVRRGRPTIWKQFGPEQAINIGDFLLVIAPSSLISTNYMKVELLKFYTHMSTKIVCGQVSEFEFNKFENEDVNFMDQYLECISGKTSTLFSGLALGVGLLANEEEESLGGLEDVFFNLGHLFQMQDDILDLYGDKLRLEKGCDIKEGKFSFLVAKHLESNPEDYHQIKEVLLKSRENTTQEDIKTLSELFVQKKTLHNCMMDIHQRIQEVLSHEYLKENDKFQMLVIELIERLMSPIKHLEVQEERDEHRVQ